MAREISNLDFALDENLPNGNLKAVQFVTVLDLVSDGAEIEGFSTPSKNNISIPESILEPSSNNSPEFTSDDERQYIELAQKDIFLNGRAIRSSAGIENIQNTSLAIRVGKENQDIMTGVNEFRQAGNLTVSADPVRNNKDPESNKKTGTINAGIDVNSTPRAVIVTLNWLRLGQLDLETSTTNAGLGINFGQFAASAENFYNAVQIRIRLRSNNGSIIPTCDLAFQMDGRSIGSFSKDYRIKIPRDIYLTQSARDTHYPITVEVLRDDVEFRADSNIGNSPFSVEKGKLVNRLEEGERRFTEFKFVGLQGVLPQITTITEFKKTAYIGLRYSAEQFPNIPQRKYFIRGIKVKIPTGTTVDISATGRVIYPNNYSFAQLTTTKHWTSDPVWILYALLTEDYGLAISDSKIDKASFFAASLYCSTPVTGQTTPRYSFNGVIKTRKKALDIIREIAGLMRATLYYRNGSLKIAIDKPETVTSYLFTNANVIDGLFNYSGVDKDKKFNQINVAYFNNDIQAQDQISIRNQELIDTPGIGLNQTNVQSLYTTDRKQAIRFGRSILYTSNFETEIVTFECGIEAACILEPFMIIKIADRTKERIRASGRIKTVTSSTVLVVDDSTDTNVGIVGDSFSVIDKNGAVQEKTIQSVNGSTVTLSSALSPLPQAGTIWAVKTGNVQHRKYRVTNIKQKDNFVFSITAIIYDDNKYEFIDTESSFGVGLEPTTLLDELSSPEITQVEEQLVVVNSRAQSQIVLDFAHVNGARSYQVAYTVDGGDPVVESLKSNQFILKNNKAATYNFSVRSLNAIFTLSTSVSTVSLEAQGLSAKPNPVANLRAEESGDNLILRFDRSTDLDVLFGGKVNVKYALTSDGTATTQNANFLKEVDGNFNEIIINDYQSGEYFLKFIDVAGNESETSTSVVINRTIASDNLLAAQIRENPNFTGAKVNLVKDNSLGGLVLSSAVTFDSISNFDTLALADGTTFASLDLVTGGGGSGIPTEGNYTFAANDIDLGAAFRFHIEPHFKKSGFDTATLWDDYTDNMDDWPDIFTTSSTVSEKSADLVFQAAKSTTSSTNISAVYTQSGTTVTITSNTHGRSVGDTIIFDATSGAGVDGTYVITSISTNTFTFTSGTSQTITTSNCTFQYFETFVNTDMIARTLSFKVLVNNQSSYENVLIEELGVNIIFRPRTERSIDYEYNSSDNVAVSNGVLTSSSSGATTVTFNKKFFTGTSAVGGSTTAFKPVVSININNMADGDFFTIDSVTSTQFVVSIKNGSSFVQRSFTYSAFGYGEG